MSPFPSRVIRLELQPHQWRQFPPKQSSTIQILFDRDRKIEIFCRPRNRARDPRDPTVCPVTEPFESHRIYSGIGEELAISCLQQLTDPIGLRVRHLHPADRLLFIQLQQMLRPQIHRGKWNVVIENDRD